MPQYRSIFRVFTPIFLLLSASFLLLYLFPEYHYLLGVGKKREGVIYLKYCGRHQGLLDYVYTIEWDTIKDSPSFIDFQSKDRDYTHTIYNILHNKRSVGEIPLVWTESYIYNKPILKELYDYPVHYSMSYLFIGKILLLITIMVSTAIWCIKEWQNSSETDRTISPLLKKQK